MFTTVNEIVYGTPAAVPVAPSKLVVMSLRTTPFSFSTSGPLEPSPGYGPPVSSGITEHDVTVAVDAAVVVVAPAAVDVVDDDAPFVVAVALLESLPPEHPATASPRPPRSTSAPRRDTGFVRTSSWFPSGSVMPPGCARPRSPNLRAVQEPREKRRRASERPRAGVPARKERANSGRL